MRQHLGESSRLTTSKQRRRRSLGIVGRPAGPSMCCDARVHGLESLHFQTSSNLEVDAHSYKSRSTDVGRGGRLARTRSSQKLAPAHVGSRRRDVGSSDPHRAIKQQMGEESTPTPMLTAGPPRKHARVSDGSGRIKVPVLVLRSILGLRPEDGSSSIQSAKRCGIKEGRAASRFVVIVVVVRRAVAAAFRARLATGTWPDPYPPRTWRRSDRDRE